MGHRQWGVVAVVFVAAACGSSVSNSDGAAGSAATTPVAGSANRATGGAGAAGGGSAGVGDDTGAEAGRAGETGSDPGCQGKLEDLKAVDVACQAELCAGTVSALACDALPAGVVKTSEAACDGINDRTGDGRVRALTFELSATRRKACYYEQAEFDAPSLLVGAQVWEDTPAFCDGTATRISAGVVPGTTCFNASSATLCDLTDPTQSAPVQPNVPARACFNGFSATCEPCCETEHPDCTGKPQDYPGFDCTPPADNSGPSFCFCSCDQQQWTCAC